MDDKPADSSPLVRVLPLPSIDERSHLRWLGMTERVTETLSTAIEFGAARRGPLSALFGFLRRLGIGERMIKTALAAFVAWEVGRLVPGNPQPYLAPLTAILVMQATIA